VDGKLIQNIRSEGFLASLFATDGETAVLVETGEVRGRYFFLPKTKPSLFNDDGDLTEAYRKKVEAAAANPSLVLRRDDGTRIPLGRVEPVGVILAMGTRHRKAMMVSEILNDRGVVITVSASGAIRVWFKGVPHR
jgi:hypothetical protein